MLSMRNGMSLHPMCLPGASQLSQIRMEFGGEENRPLHLNMSGMLNMNQEPSTQNLYNPNQSYVPDMSNVNSETGFGLESSIQDHLGPFPLTNSSKVKSLPFKFKHIWGQVIRSNRPFDLVSM